MPLETATYTDDLVVTNPAASDGMNGADDHMRLIKASIKNTIPGATGPITTAAGGHQSRTSGTSTAPAYTFAEEPTLGIYRVSAGVMSIAGGKLKGALPVGGVHSFLVEPAGLGKGGVAGTYEYLELDGSSWPATSFPDLAAHLGVAAGGTIVLPNMKATGRFPRSRTAAVAAGTAQANAVVSHLHAINITSGAANADHTHAFSGTTGNDAPDHTHGYSTPVNSNNQTGGGSFPAMAGAFSAANTGGASTRHQHAFSGNTGGISANHAHAVVGNTAATGDTETRPEALSFVFCIKT